MGKHYPGRRNGRGLFPKGVQASDLPSLLVGYDRRMWFLSYTQFNGDCLEWMGSRRPFGYGCVTIGGKSFTAHRVAYAMYHAIDPAGQSVCHSCDNPPCVRRDHLFLGSQADNNRDMRLKGRTNPAYGARSGTAILNEHEVRLMRKLHAQGMGFRRLGQRFGVARMTAKYAVTGVTWKHIQ